MKHIKLLQALCLLSGTAAFGSAIKEKIKTKSPILLATEAIKKDDPKELARALDKDPQLVSHVGKDNWTLLNSACNDGKLELAALLIKRGAALNHQTASGETSLHQACRGNNNKLVQLLLNSGAIVKVTDNRKNTPLHVAAGIEDIRVLKQLIVARHSISVLNIENSNGSTPLHIACEKGHLACVKLLVEYGASAGKLDKEGHTPLTYAQRLQNGPIKKAILEVLAKAGAPKTANNSEIKTPATPQGQRKRAYACAGKALPSFHKCLSDSCRTGDMSEVRKRVSKTGFEVNTPDELGRTVLHYACDCGLSNRKIVEELLGRDAKVHARDREGRTPLHFAAQNQNRELVVLLIECGALNVPDNNGTLPSDFVRTAAGYEDLFTMLSAQVSTEPLRLSALFPPEGSSPPHSLDTPLDKPDPAEDVDSSNDTAKSATPATQEQGGIESMNETTPLESPPAGPATPNACQQIPDITPSSPRRRTRSCTRDISELNEACKRGDYSRVEDLCLSGAPINTNHNETTPLHLACEYGHLKIVRFLVDKGALVNAQDENHATPLCLACCSPVSDGNTQDMRTVKDSDRLLIVRFLLAQTNIEVDTPDRSGDSPLHNACRVGYLPIVELLVKHHADRSKENVKEKLTPYQVAQKEEHTSITAFLEDYHEHEASGDAEQLYSTGTTGTFEAPVCEENDLGKQLLEACQQGNASEVNWLLQIPDIPLETKAANGMTPLIIAAWKGHFPIVRQLLEYGALVNATDCVSSTALHHAAALGHTTIVNALVSYNANVNAQNIQYSTPLHEAVHKRALSIVNKLIEYGQADLTIRNSEGKTALDLAQCSSAIEMQDIVTALEKYRSSNKHNPIQKAPEQAGDTAHAEKTLQQLTSFQESSIDMVAATFQNKNLDEKNKLDEIQTLLAILPQSETINTSTKEGATLLHLAVLHGNSDIVACLIHNGAFPNAVDPQTGTTPLHYACVNGNLPIVNVLLAAGANKTLKDKNGQTPGALAASAGHNDIASLMSRVSEVVDDEGMTPPSYDDSFNDTAVECEQQPPKVESASSIAPPEKFPASAPQEKQEHVAKLFAACEEGDVATAEDLLEQPQSLASEKNEQGATPLHVAVWNKHLDIVQLLLAAGANVNATTNKKETALHLACKRSLAAIVNTLLQPNHKAKPGLFDAQQQTALHIAVHKKSTDIVKALLNAKAPIKAKDQKKRTPLHIAAEMGLLDIAEALLEAKADVESTDEDGQTPLHYAATEGDEKLVSLLLEHSANIDATDDEDRTPLSCAIASGQDHIMALLESKGATT